jgi:hypothetical protein
MAIYANHDNYLTGINVLLNLTWPPFQFPFTGLYNLREGFFKNQVVKF